MSWQCNRPFTRLEFFKYGIATMISPCCQSWLKQQPIRIYKNIDIKKHWLKSFKELRKSIIDESYTFCQSCPYYNSKSNRISIDSKISLSPKVLAFSGNKACNLKCITCRQEINTINDPIDLEFFLSCIDDNTEILEFNGSGEVFVGNTLTFLRSYTKIKNVHTINLITNGTLLNEDMWKSLSQDTKDAIKIISVSIDAACETTYQKIRGFDFITLCQNLKFISSLQKDLRFNFVVQKDNVDEMIDFCEMATRFNTKAVLFSKLNDWGAVNVSQLEPDPLELQKQKALIAISDFNFEIYSNV